MALKLTTEIIELRTRHPFVIARGGSSDYRVVWVRLTDADGVEGWGEADPSSYYKETADTVLAALQQMEPHLPADPFALEDAEARFTRVAPNDRSARAALSAALHDLVGLGFVYEDLDNDYNKALGYTLWQGTLSAEARF